MTTAFTVSLSIKKLSVQIDLGRLSGHEEITRQAMNFALVELERRGVKDRLLEVLKKEMTDLEPRAVGTKGGEAKNPILRGNYATDVPAAEVYNWEIDLKEEYGIPQDVDWHTNAMGQVLHFLRNPIIEAGEVAKEGDPLQSAYDACMDGQQLITYATLRGYDYWKLYLEAERKARDLIRPENEKKYHREADEARRKALFMFGHATHILQDSFSPAHVLRSEYGGRDGGNNDIVDVCFYDPSEAVGSILDDIKKGAEHSHVHTAWEVLTYEDNDEDIAGIERATIEALNRSREGKVCKHDTFDFRDGIWIRTGFQESLTRESGWAELEKDLWDRINKYRIWILKYEPVKKCKGNYMSTDGGKHQCLKHEARLARTATARYFTILVDYMIEARKHFEKTGEHLDEEKLVRRLHDNLYYGNNGELTYGMNQVMPEGVLRCDRLSKETGYIQL